MPSELDKEIYGDLRQEFICESRDNLDDMESSLNNFFTTNNDPQEVIKLLRQKTHTIKGLARPFGFSLLETIAHQFEDFMLEIALFSQSDATASQLFIDTMKECLLQVEEPDREMRIALLKNLPKGKPTSPIPFEADRPIDALIITSSRTVYKKVGTELQNLGFHINHAPSSLFGIEFTALHQPDIVIISDILDYLSGVDLICAFVAMPVTENIPVIFMTSYELEHSEVQNLPSLVPIISLDSNIEEGILSALTSIEARFNQSNNACQ